MLTKKTMLITIIVILTVGIFAFFILRERYGPEKITIKTEQGEVKITDITENPVEKLSMGGVTFQSTEDFLIEYYPGDQGFIIALLNKDTEKAQIAAEQEFLRALKINKEDACKLKVSITVPYTVNEKFGGGIYKLSFCEGGQLLKN
ncbi:MAG: hypothetical protein NT136_00315 [Candidatus Moranbacteria bacterium]|nr:hypothetical protein [Candidatus Moranbacteria bacterium]